MVGGSGGVLGRDGCGKNDFSFSVRKVGVACWWRVFVEYATWKEKLE